MQDSATFCVLLEEVTIKTMKMKKNLLSMSILLLMFVECSSDDGNDVKEVWDFDPTFEVNYYNQPIGLDEKLGYWVGDKFVEMVPQSKPPYTLLVRWNDSQGKEAIDYVLSKNDGVMTLVEGGALHGSDDKGEYRIISNKYIESPYFFVSIAYQTADIPIKDRYDILIIPGITLKVTDDQYLESLKTEYADVMTFTKKSKLEGIYDFECHLNSSRDVLRLCDEIGQRKGILWAEPNMYGVWAF